jgi:hypothetical protein
VAKLEILVAFLCIVLLDSASSQIGLGVSIPPGLLVRLEIGATTACCLSAMEVHVSGESGLIR